MSYEQNLVAFYGFGPACVFHVPQNTETTPELTADWVQAAISTYEHEDDVFHTDFLKIVVFIGANRNDVLFTDSAREYLAKLGNQHVVFDSSIDLLPGPYLAVGSELRDVWKIANDTHGTCMATLQPQSKYTPPSPFRHRFNY